jgi:hypothetical protein
MLLALMLLFSAPFGARAADISGDAYGGLAAVSASSGVNVTFRLIGATLSAGDVNLGNPALYRGAEYVTWIGTRRYAMPDGATVYDLFVKALADAGILANGQDANYVEDIIAPAGYRLSEFTNGQRSGWMYTINGWHPGYGLKEQSLADGDAVIWHYVNDYAYEVQDWFDDLDYPALGDGTYWSRWLRAADDPYTEPTQAPTPTTEPTPTSGPAQEPTPTFEPTQTPTPTQAPPEQPGTPDYEAALSGVLAHIRQSTPNPEVGSVGGEWAVLALARGGVADDALNANWLENLKAVVLDIGSFSDVVVEGNKVTLHTRKYTENERVILALSSIGVDASAWNGWDFVSALADKEADGSTYKAVWQGVNGAIFALIALDTGGYLTDDPQIRTEYIDYILDNQDANVGWSISGTAKQDMTAMGIQSLAPYYESDSRVKSAVDAALSYLSSQQSAIGDVGYDSEGTAQTIVALTALGLDPDADPRFVKDGNSLIDGLLAYRQADGSFKHILDGSSGVNQMSTEQAAYALAAYDRFVHGQNRLYDMTDVVVHTPGGAEPTEAPADKAALNAAIARAEALAESPGESAYTASTWNVLQAALASAKAVAENPGAALTEVDAAQADLTAAIDALALAEIVPPANDKAALNAAIALAEALAERPGESAYTASSWSVLQTALTIAKAMAQEPSVIQAEVDAAKNALLAAIDALAPAEAEPPVDKAALNAAIARAEALAESPVDSAYTASTWNVLQAALSAAKAIAENPSAALAEVDATQADLTAAINALQTAGGDPGSGGEDKLHVTFRLIGATLAGRDVNISGEINDSLYVTWIPTRSYAMNPRALVYDLFVQALADAGMSAEGQDRNYVAAILAPSSLGGYRLSEFTNGRYSGWMYTINGRHPGYGLKEQALNDGDEVIWHYVNDYRHEVEDWFDDLDYPALGDGSWWSKWLDAPDSFGGTAGSAPSNPGAADPGQTGDNSAQPGGGGGGGGGGDTSLGQTVTQPTLVTKVEYQAVATDGAVKAEAKTADVTKAVQAAVLKGDAAVAIALTGAGSIQRAEMTLPKTALNEVRTARLDLMVSTPLGAVTFSGGALTSIGAAAGETVRTVLSAAGTVDGKVHMDIEVYVGDAAVSGFGGDITVSLPYGPESGVPAKDYDLLTVYSVDDDGGYSEMQGARYSPAAGAMLFAATHLSRFFISEWISPFTDTTKADWFYRAVRYSYANGLIAGTGENTFSPKTNLTRAMLLTILAREAGVPTGSGETWYSAAVEWGVANGITDGANMTADVTREQLVTILYRYARLKGRDVTQTATLAGYADAGAVSPWAAGAVSWANATGLLTGRAAGSLAPDGTATRAEAAAILQRFIESGAGRA